MAKLIDMTLATSLNSADYMYVVQSGISKRAQLSQLVNLLGNSGNSNNSVATRTALAALSPSNGTVYTLTEDGREGQFKYRTGNYSAFVTADTAQGIYVPLTSNPSGSSGCWVRIFAGDANFSWWGSNGNNSTDNLAAMNSALATMKLLRSTGFAYGAGGSVGLFISTGKYYFSGQVTVSHDIRIYGAAGGGFGGGTMLRWPLGVNGFFFDTNASGCVLDSLTLKGGWTVSDNEGEFHAVKNYRPLIRRDLFVDGWQGDGFYDVNDAASTGGAQNSNGDSIERCLVQNCRRGLYFNGGDVNGKEVRGCNFLVNRWCGIHEKSFLGNTYLMCLTESNGFYPGWTTGASNRPASYVRYNNRVFAVVGGQETWASTNAPPSTATSNQGWIYWYGGATGSLLAQGIPDWVSGITLRAGGGVIHQGDSNRSSFIGLYSEDNQMNQFDYNFAGNYGANMNYGALVNASTGTRNNAKPNFIKGQTWFGNFTHDPGEGGSFNFKSSSGVFGYNNNISDPVADNLYQYYATNLYTDVWFKSFGLGSENIDGYLKAGVNSMRLGGKTGVYLGLNFVNYMELTSAGFGYTAGTGANVTQATSRTTAVTINKPTGSITLVSAAGSTTIAAFTVNNSCVAATDTIIVNQKSGTDKYRIYVTAVAAGSFQISYATLSGTTTEQPVFNFAIVKGQNS